MEKLWLTVDNETREVVVTNRHILMVNPTTGEKEPMMLTRIGPAPTSVDVVVATTFKKCGFPRSARHPHSKALTPRRMAKFLVANMSHLKDRDRLWIRLFGKPIPAACKTNSLWLDISAHQGTTTFDPMFWTRLFQDVDCRVSYDIIRSSLVLNTYSVKANACGIDYTQRILPFMFLESLLGKNYKTLLNDPGFTQYMYPGISPKHQQLKALMDTYSEMSVLKSCVPAQVENAFVILFCSTYFRGLPVSRMCIRTKTIPMLDIVPTKAELDAWAAEEEEKAREKHLREIKKAEEEAAAAAATQKEEKTTTEVETLPAVVTPPKPAPKEEEPPYIPYPSLPTTEGEWKKITEIMGQISCKTGPIGNQVRFLSWLTDKGTFGTDEEFVAISKALAAYRKAMGFSAFVDRWVVLQSAFVCLIGGKDWVELYATLFPGMPNPENPKEARNALRMFGTAGLSAIVRAIDVSGITGVPMAVMRISQEFLSVVGSHIKAEDKMDFDIKFPKMMMVIYAEMKEDPLAWVDMWRAFGWSHSINVTNAVTEWKKRYPVLPVEVRAEIIATMVMPRSTI